MPGSGTAQSYDTSILPILKNGQNIWNHGSETWDSSSSIRLQTEKVNPTTPRRGSPGGDQGLPGWRRGAEIDYMPRCRLKRAWQRVSRMQSHSFSWWPMLTHYYVGKPVKTMDRSWKYLFSAPLKSLNSGMLLYWICSLPNRLLPPLIPALRWCTFVEVIVHCTFHSHDSQTPKSPAAGSVPHPQRSSRMKPRALARGLLWRRGEQFGLSDGLCSGGYRLPDGWPPPSPQWRTAGFICSFIH